jgi:predicted permease
VQARLAVEYPQTDAGVRPRIVPLKEVVVGPARPSLWLLFGSVSMLLLIACTNIAGLLLSRNAQRQDELAVRYAIGASRRAVGLQVLTESAVLAVAGGALGAAVAVAISAWLRRMAPDLPRLDEMALNGRALLYIAAATTIVALLCGLAPILRGTSARNPVVRGGRAQLAPRQRLQWLLVGVQVALSVALLVGAGLLGRSLDRFSRIDGGFVADRVLTFRISASFGEERDYGRTVQRINRTLDELAQLPGIEATATTGALPGLGANAAWEFQIVELSADGGAPRTSQFRFVSPSYFETTEIPLLEGQLCRRPETADGTEEVMVNRVWAERFAAGRSPVGMHVAADQPDRIAGVVGDAREMALDEEPVPVIYGCFTAQTPMPWFLARTTGDPAAAISAIRARLRQLEPLRSMYDAEPLDERIDAAYAQNRVRTIVLALFAATALSLVCLGVYGTVSYTASLRRREVGLRVALGASRITILRQFIADGSRVVGVATAAGLVLSLLLARGLSGMLYGIAPTDPLTLGGAIALVLIVGLGAAIVPAIRVASADPARVLRGEAS